MTEDGAMDSLLAAVAVAAASALNAPSYNSICTSTTPLVFPAVPIAPTILPSPPPLPPCFRTTTSTPVSIPLPISDSASEPPLKGSRVFSTEERKVLEVNYHYNKFPSRLHLHTLATAFGKTMDKVRTWFNNRRALDRKLGRPVSRNPGGSFASESVITHKKFAKVLTAESSLKHIESHDQKLIQGEMSFRQILSLDKSMITDTSASNSPHALVKVNPGDTSWSDFLPHFNKSSPRQSTCGLQTVRVSPLRLRTVRLVIGKTVINGALPDCPDLDNGLELKVLFGKRKLVYEWYCGHHFSDACLTGGPYAKMEIPLATITNIKLAKVAAYSNVILSFHLTPSLFMQTEENIHKFKLRTQQRQYRRVLPHHFPLQEATGSHLICLRPEDGTTLLRLLANHSPTLASLIHFALRSLPNGTPDIPLHSKPSVDLTGSECAIRKYIPYTAIQSINLEAVHHSPTTPPTTNRFDTISLATSDLSHSKFPHTGANVCRELKFNLYESTTSPQAIKKRKREDDISIPNISSSILRTVHDHEKFITASHIHHTVKKE